MPTSFIKTQLGQVKKYVEWCDMCYGDDPIMENFIWFCDTKKCLKKCRDNHLQLAYNTHKFLIEEYNS